MATRCFSPPDKVAGSAFFSQLVQHSLPKFCTRLCSNFFLQQSQEGRQCFSVTVNGVISSNAWKIKPIFRYGVWQARLQLKVLVSVPFKSILPEVVLSSKPINESNVDFPEPDGPTIATFSP